LHKEHVKEAADNIKGLNPRPAQGFGRGGILRYVDPDVTIVKFQDRFEILQNSYTYPMIHVNQEYLQMLKTSNDKEVKDYLTGKLRQVEQVQQAIEKRGSILLGLATGAQPIFGYNYGSGQKDRVKQAYRIILAVSTIVLILAFLVFQFAPMNIVRLFGSESELYNEFAVKCFKIFLLACPINGLQMANGIFFQSIGKPTQATVLSLSRQIVYLLPATILLPLSLGVEGALWAGPLADVLAFITTLIMLKLYWKKI